MLKYSYFGRLRLIIFLRKYSMKLKVFCFICVQNILTFESVSMCEEYGNRWRSNGSMNSSATAVQGNGRESPVREDKESPLPGFS